MTVTAQPNGSGPGTAEPTVGQLVSDATANLSTIIHSEIELAKLELRSSVKNGLVGIGFFGAAAAIGLFSLVFGFIALAEGIVAIGIWRWAAYLIVFGVMILMIGLLGFLGVRKMKRIKAPERTIATSRDTVAYLKAKPKHG